MEVLSPSFTGGVTKVLLFQAETAFLQKAISLIEAEYVTDSDLNGTWSLEKNCIISYIIRVPYCVRIFVLNYNKTHRVLCCFVTWYVSWLLDIFGLDYAAVCLICSQKESITA